eukprot:scaffold12.g8278.t1
MRDLHKGGALCTAVDRALLADPEPARACHVPDWAALKAALLAAAAPIDAAAVVLRADLGAQQWLARVAGTWERALPAKETVAALAIELQEQQELGSADTGALVALLVPAAQWCELRSWGEAGDERCCPPCVRLLAGKFQGKHIACPEARAAVLSARSLPTRQRGAMAGHSSRARPPSVQHTLDQVAPLLTEGHKVLSGLAQAVQQAVERGRRGLERKLFQAEEAPALLERAEDLGLLPPGTATRCCSGGDAVAQCSPAGVDAGQLYAELLRQRAEALARAELLPLRGVYEMEWDPSESGQRQDDGEDGAVSAAPAAAAAALQQREWRRQRDAALGIPRRPATDEAAAFGGFRDVLSGRKLDLEHSAALAAADGSCATAELLGDGGRAWQAAWLERAPLGGQPWKRLHSKP